MRYERKYKIDNLSLSLIEQSIRLHPASFRPIFPDRQVNNIYFDSSNWVTFQENVMGIADRKKFRVRWYGNQFDFIETPSFEIKIKSNQLGDKISYSIPSFHLSDLVSTSKKINELASPEIPLRPTLLNSYWRSYYGTPDGKFRITIDRNLSFFSLLNNAKFHSYAIHNDDVIVELKYDETLDSVTDRITQNFPFRMTKSSKYITGIELVNG